MAESEKCPRCNVGYVCPECVAKTTQWLEDGHRPTCLGCGVDLAADRLVKCGDCDVVVETRLQERHERREREDRERFMLTSGLPRSYRRGERLLTDLPAIAQQTVTACKLLGSSVAGLYLHGDAGTFKTSVAAAFLAEQIRGGGEGRYVFVPDLFTDLYAIYSAGDQRSRADLVDGLVSTPRLVLDDLGKEKASEHAASVLFEILDGRYRTQGPGRWLIVTSNLAIHELAARFFDDTGNPIARRLAEMTVPVPMERGAA